jgi:hypothetical protein
MMLPLRVYTTVATRPLASLPVRHRRCSIGVEWATSSFSTPSGLVKTSKASAKSSPCGARFSAFFSSSHSHSIMYTVYPEE